MCNQGDVHCEDGWKSRFSIEDLKKIVIEKGYSAVTVSNGQPSFGFACFKSFDFKLEKKHLKPITSCCHAPCKIYIYKRKP